jgi:uncharacterized protein (TIGR03083 family)
MPAPDYADEYTACRDRLRDLLLPCSAAQLATVVPACPEWTVKDCLAHVVAIAVKLVNRQNPTGDTQAWVDEGVAERRGASVAELFTEWDGVGEAFATIQRKVPQAFGGLTYDAVAHEHDIRAAIGAPGARDDAGVWASLEIMVPMVERDLAAKGPVPGTIRLDAGDRSWTIGSGAPEVALQTSGFELMRVLGSRRSRAQVLAAGWVGDVAPFLDALAHLPLPEADLVE